MARNSLQKNIKSFRLLNQDDQVVSGYIQFGFVSDNVGGLGSSWKGDSMVRMHALRPEDGALTQEQ